MCCFVRNIFGKLEMISQVKILCIQCRFSTESGAAAIKIMLNILENLSKRYAFALARSVSVVLSRRNMIFEIILQYSCNISNRAKNTVFKTWLEVHLVHGSQLTCIAWPSLWRSFKIILSVAGFLVRYCVLTFFSCFYYYSYGLGE